MGGAEWLSYVLNRTGGVVWALKSPSDPLRGQVGGGRTLEIESFWALWALVLKTTYAPMIYTSLCPGSAPKSPKKLLICRTQPPLTCPQKHFAQAV
jgi:hypothetical protein